MLFIVLVLVVIHSGDFHRYNRESMAFDSSGVNDIFILSHSYGLHESCAQYHTN